MEMNESIITYFMNTKSMIIILHKQSTNQREWNDINGVKYKEICRKLNKPETIGLVKSHTLLTNS